MFIFYLSFFILIIATYEDIKKREVYDFINYLLALIPLVYGLFVSIYNMDLTFFYVLGLEVIGFIVGTIFYFTGLWGGGDLKYLISIPGLMYFYTGNLLNKSYVLDLLTGLNPFYNALWLTGIFLMLSFLFGGFLTVGIVMYNYLKNIEKIKISLKKKYILFGSFVVLLILFLFTKLDYLRVLYVALFLMVWISFIAKEVEKYIFVTKKSIDEIVLGDWVVEDVLVGKKKIYLKEDFRLGVDEKQLKSLKNYFEKGKLKALLVKDGIPFFIGFLVAFPFFLF